MEEIIEIQRKKMRPIRTDFVLSLSESEECVATSSRVKLTEANQNSQLVSLIELCDLERGGVVINDPPPTPVLPDRSEPSAKSSVDEIGKIWLDTHSRFWRPITRHERC